MVGVSRRGESAHVLLSNWMINFSTYGASIIRVFFVVGLSRGRECTRVAR